MVKLDIDTSRIEVPLAMQLLENPKIHKLVDVFYFEHHVHLNQLAGAWGGSMKGSVQDSLQLFTQIREKGLPCTTGDGDCLVEFCVCKNCETLHLHLHFWCSL